MLRLQAAQLWTAAPCQASSRSPATDHCYITCSASSAPRTSLANGTNSSSSTDNGSGSHSHDGSSLSSEIDAEQALKASRRRIRRLELLAALRKLYRNLLRAEGLLAQPFPIWKAAEHGGALGMHHGTLNAVVQALRY